MDRISVVIPTQARLPVLARTLTLLADQELDGLEVEVLVVCSGSTEGYREQVRELVSGLPLAAKVLVRAEGGAAGARKEGVGAAEAELILFLNDDTPPLSRDLVRRHAELHAEDPDEWRGVLGRVVWDPEVEATPVMDWLTRTGKMNDYSLLAAEEAQRPTLYAPNLSLKRSALVRAGGFDERFWRYGWAEYDLALRLFDLGFRISLVPELVVGHHHRYTLADSVRRMESVGRGANLLNRVHAARGDLATPAPAGAKALVGRALAPVAPLVPVPGWLPPRLRDSAFRTLHYAALARGYAGPPVPAGDGPEGGIPGVAETSG
jgi:GT2 family glycosyltransferase